MEIKIFDENNDGLTTAYDIGDLADIERIVIGVIDRSEVLGVLYKNGRVFEQDFRILYADNTKYLTYCGSYVVYDAKSGVNLLNDREFINRKNPFWMLEGDDNEFALVDRNERPALSHGYLLEGSNAK